MTHYHPFRSCRSWFLALCTLFLVAIFYIHSTQSTYIIADEYLAYRFTRDDLGQTIAYLVNRDVHPPLWFSFFWGWRRIVGDSDFAGRIQAVYFSFITLALVYQIGRRWFGSARVGIFAMAFLSVSNLFFVYALQIRPYGLAMLLATLSMMAFQHWLMVKTRRAAVVYAGSAALLLYVHYFLILLVLLQGLFFLIRMRSTGKLWRQLPLVGGSAFMLFLPWFPSFINQIQHIREVELASGNARGVAGSSVTTFVTSAEEILKFAHLASNGLIWIDAILIALGVWYWRKHVNFRLALAWAIGVPILTFVINLLFAVYNPRYIVNFTVGLALVMAAAIGQLPTRARWIGFAGFVALNLWMLPALIPRDIIPYRALFNDLVAAYQPGDVIFVDPPDNRGVEFNWQYLQQFTPEMRQSVVRRVEEALPARRVWHLTRYWFNDGIRAIYNQLEQSHPRQSGFGKCDVEWCFLIQLMEAPPWDSPQVFGSEMAFWGADIDSVTTDAISMRLWWRLDQTPTADYSIGVHLLDENGLLRAQSDGPIQHYNAQTFNTTQLEPGKIYVDFRTIHMAAPLSPGEYKLQLVVYHWQTSERLALPDQQNTLALSTIHID